MEFTVEITGLASLTAAFREYPSIALPRLQTALSAAGAVLAKDTVKGVVPWRTGFLTQSFRAEMANLTLRWYPTASYAPYVEFGTAPHIIQPRDAQALYWPGAQHPVKLVHHPGTKPQDFMGAIVERSQEEINEQFGNALQQIVAQIAAQGA